MSAYKFVRVLTRDGIYHNAVSKLTLERGQLVIVPPRNGYRFGVVHSIAEVDQQVIHHIAIDAAITPETPDTICRDEYGYTRIYNWKVPENVEAIYWLEDDGPIFFSNFSELRANLERAYTEKFFSKAERSF